VSGYLLDPTKMNLTGTTGRDQYLCSGQSHYGTEPPQKISLVAAIT
jgi:hypothetical protein